MPAKLTIRCCKKCHRTLPRIAFDERPNGQFHQRCRECRATIAGRRAENWTVDPETGCWIWQGKKLVTGYGRKWVNGKTMPAHVWVYEQMRGPIPDGLVPDHLCRNPPCVNPDHIEPVTSAENTRRGRVAKLTIEQAREIRAASTSRASIAARYGISTRMVGHIKNGRFWREDD